MPSRDREAIARRIRTLGAICVSFAWSVTAGLGRAGAQTPHPPASSEAVVAARPHAAPAGRRVSPVGLPQDAGPHDANAIIEWWYFNSFLTTAAGHHYAVVGSFFRTGINPKSKGHYLIYSLIDLDNRSQSAYAVLDRANLSLLKLYLGLAAARDSSDPEPLELLGKLQREEMPPAHRISGQNAIVKTAPLFSIELENNILDQTSADARSWKVNLTGDDWTLDLTFDQKDRPPMLVGGNGKTGLRSPDDMYYLSLTRMAVAGTLTQGGVVDKVTGPGWIDRQWGASWVAGNNGWDWFGLQLDDGSDLIVYRVHDNQTGKVLRSDATLLSKEGVQSLDSSPVLSDGSTSPLGTGPNLLVAGSTMPAAKSGLWTDPNTGIAFPQIWSISMPKLDLQLTTISVFPEQVIPVLAMGHEIWEGAVTVTGVRSGKPVSGHGFMELVGYKAGAPGAAVVGRPSP